MPPRGVLSAGLAMDAGPAEGGTPPSWPRPLIINPLTAVRPGGRGRQRARGIRGLNCLKVTSALHHAPSSCPTCRFGNGSSSVRAARWSRPPSTQVVALLAFKFSLHMLCERSSQRGFPAAWAAPRGAGGVGRSAFSWTVVVGRAEQRHVVHQHNSLVREAPESKAET